MSATTPSTTQEALVADLRAAFFELLGAERRLRGRDQRGRRDPNHDLTNAQLRALMVLRDGERSAGQVAESAYCTPATTTVMLDHLETAGIITRRRSPHDRRACLVSLTPHGREIVERQHTHAQTIWQTRFAQTPPHDLHTATHTLRNITNMLDTL